MNSIARDNCLQALRGMGAGGNRSGVSVAEMQPRVLTLPQLEALAQIQDAMASIATLQAAINQLATLHALPVRRVGLVELGMLHAEIEALLWDSARTAELLKRGGIPAEVRPLAPSPVVVEALHLATDGRIAA